jgi:hypothetical protein
MQPYKDYMINKYSFMYYPTCYFDGGQKAFVGGDEREFLYEDSIETVGAIAVHDFDFSVSMEWLGSAQIRINVNIVNNEYENFAPDAPSAPTGPNPGEVGISYEFTSLGTDPNRQQVYYMWDWGNGEMSEWQGPYDYGQPNVLSHSWAASGQYDILVKLKDIYDLEGPWSNAGSIDIWRCGDANDDNNINILDIIMLINYKYKGGVAPFPEESGDVNNDGAVNILDVVTLINYKYKGGPPPACPGL